MTPTQTLFSLDQDVHQIIAGAIKNQQLERMEIGRNLSLALENIKFIEKEDEDSYLKVVQAALQKLQSNIAIDIKKMTQDIKLLIQSMSSSQFQVTTLKPPYMPLSPDLSTKIAVAIFGKFPSSVITLSLNGYEIKPLEVSSEKLLFEIPVHALKHFSSEGVYLLDGMFKYLKNTQLLNRMCGLEYKCFKIFFGVIGKIPHVQSAL